MLDEGGAGEIGSVADETVRGFKSSFLRSTGPVDGHQWIAFSLARYRVRSRDLRGEFIGPESP